MILWLLALGALLLLAGRLLDLSRDRRLCRNSGDPTFQGDGIRWTLSLLLPHIPLPWRLTAGRGDEGVAYIWAQLALGIPPPFGTDMLPLTAAQRIACWHEWLASQVDQARLGRPLERWETIERDGDG
jgi:hypothetical protein